MKRIHAWFLVLAVAAVPALSEDKPALPGYVIPRSEVRTLPVNAAGRHYALFIGLPARCATEPDKRYPVKVAPVPYAGDAREAYQQGWRTRQA